MDGSPDQAQDVAGPAVGERFAYYLKVLRRRWQVIVLVPIIAVLVSLAVGLTAQKKYDATSKVVVNPSNQVTAILNPNASTNSDDPERDLNTEVARIETVPIAQAVRNRLDLKESSQDLLKQVSTSVEGTTHIVDIKVRDPDPARAAGIANAYAAEYVQARENDARQVFQQAAAQARRQLESMSLTQQNSARGLRLKASLRDLEVDSALQTGNAQVIQSATKPTSAATPRIKFGAALALFLGLILGVIVAAALELLDRRVKDEDDVTRIADVPVLAIIPSPRRTIRRQTLEGDVDQIEGFRALATNLRFFKLGGDVKTMMIVSPSQVVGKTSVTLSLAAALVEFGQKVVAVECDLRRPRFAEYLGLSHAPGLSSALAGMAAWSQEVMEIDIRNPRAGGSSSGGRSGHFTVLPGGPTPPNPQALLGSSDMHELLLELRSSADVILIDTPPLGPLTDAVPLIPWVDGVALVVRLERTTRDELRKASHMLAELDAPVLGTILTGGTRPSRDYYGSSPFATPKASAPSQSGNGSTGNKSFRHSHL
jgi:capsular exopolysaccharide synthesis family protein